MKLSFKRITSTGSFIPEIDGLRFIAITSVVLSHLSNFICVKDRQHYIDSFDYSILKTILSHGGYGVSLFFVISGFILGLPFAKYYLGNAEPVNLKAYFLRRLTRLEPPYVLIMTVLFFGAVYIAKRISLNDGALSYFSSVFYLHNFIFPTTYSILNGVVWSLEIEIQFYILAPLMAYMFSVKSPVKRRALLVFIALFFLVFSNFNTLPFRSLINFVHYFLIGFLLADLYVSKSFILPKTKFDIIFALFFFIIIWIFRKEDFDLNYQRFSLEIIQLISIFFLYYYVLFRKTFKLLSLSIITNIGGMCYTIYLLHSPIISMFGNPLLKISFSKFSFFNIFIYSILLIAAIIIFSGIFFQFVERPCMDKNWYKKVSKKLLAISK